MKEQNQLAPVEPNVEKQLPPLAVEEEKKPLPDVHYSFRFSTLIICVFVLGLLLCAAGIGLTTWQLLDFLKGDISSIYEWMKYILFYIVCVVLAVLIIAMLVRSRYTLTSRELITQFGLIKSKYELKKIYSLQLLNGSKKLAIYFDDFKTKYSVIAVKEIWFDDFIKQLLLRNPRIEFAFSTAEDENQAKKK